MEAGCGSVARLPWVTMAAEATPTIAGFAVIGKQNNPLFVKSFGTEDHLKFQFVVHTSLDIVDERRAYARCLGYPCQPSKWCL